ncbi:MAG: glycosyltransferase family 39 protein [Dehalococcoidia bacterium]
MSVVGETRTLTLPVPARAAAGIQPRVLGRFALIAAICAIPVVLYLPFLTEPLFRDEGLYATVAQMMLDGKIPYRDAFDNKPPMIFGWYATSFMMFGEHVWAPRLLASLLLSGATFLMYLEGKLLFSHRAGLAAALALACSFGLATLEMSANTEAFMIPPLVGALYCFSMGQKTSLPGWYAAAGFLSGIAIATKHISLFVFVLYVALLAWPLVRAGGWRELRTVAFRDSGGALIGGCLVAFVAVVAPFAATGTLPELFEATVVYTVMYVGDGAMSDKIGMLLDSPTYVTVAFGPLLPLGLLGILQITKSGATGHRPLVLGWLAANWLGIIAAGRFYDHYYTTLLAPMALLAPLGVIFIRNHWSHPIIRLGMPAAIGLLAAATFSQNADVYLRETPEARHIAKYADDDRAAWENEGPAFGHWLNKNTEPGETIYNLGFQSELYFYADRKSPTRFIMDRPFWTNHSYIDEALEDLQANPPAYIIDSAVYEGWTTESLYTPDIEAWLAANYRYMGKVYYAGVYERNGR